jgi:RNase H-fold protein (predicted Holliday junction resolvase)
MSIDRWRKRIGLAYKRHDSDIIFPIWSVDNNQDMLYTIAHKVVEHRIDKIIVGYPTQRSHVQRGIDSFIKELWFVIDPLISIERVNEDYSSVIAWGELQNYKKTAAEDALAAVHLLRECFWLKS